VNKKIISAILVLLMLFGVVYADSGGGNLSLDLLHQDAYGCYFHVSSLAYDWNGANYNALVITDGSTTDGSTTDPDGTWYAVENPGVDGTHHYVDGYASDLTPETRYTLRAYLMLATGEWKYAGSDSIKTTPEVLPPDPYSTGITAVGNNGAKITFVIGEDCPYTEFKHNTSNNEPDYWATYDERTTSGTNTTEGSITIYDLPYDDTSYFYLRSRDSSGVASAWVSGEEITTLSPLPPSPPTITNRFDGGVDLSCGSVSRAYTYYFEYRKQGDTTWNQVSSSTNSVSITGLQYGTVYEFRAKTDLIETYSSINIGTTAPKMPTISAGAVTYSSIAINVAALAGNCDKVKVECYEINGTLVSTNWIDPTGRTFPSSRTTTFSNLNRNYSYKFIATAAYDAGGDGTGTGTWSESVPSAEVVVTTLNRPDNWAWSYNITSGGAVYQSSYNSSTGVLTAYIMPASEWWDFQMKINDFRTYMGLPDYSFLNVNSGDGCTPAIINDAIDAINPMLTTGQISHVSAGNVSASIFNTMRDRLNSL
jgi:hypothetical protein